MKQAPQPPPALGQRPQDWSTLSQQSWDLIVVGGGITGAGVLREAARLGLKVLLLEQQDFAWGTSSRSSKMVHGGLRYLGQGDYKLTQHSLQERERLLQEVPGLVDRMGYYFTLRKDKSPPPWAVKILLWLYDKLAGIRDHRRVSLPELGERVEGIDQQLLKDCYYYTDAVTDDARLVLRVLHEAIADGAEAINYVNVERLINDDNDRVTGVQLQDQITQQRVDINARMVINATGAWADKLRNQVNQEKRVRPLRGSHLVIPSERLPLSDAVTLMHPNDHRAMFVFPWESRTVIGTTDLDHRDPLDREAAISETEVHYLLAAANDLFPEAKLSVKDVISSWSGVRPVIGSEKSKDPSKERRDHAVWQDGSLITVSGGKLTTFRLIALDVMAIVCDQLSINTATNNAPVFSVTTISDAELTLQAPSIEPTLAQLLVARYGNAALQIVSRRQTDELSLIAGTQVCLAECRWLMRNEAVTHLDDLMLRRTRLGQLLERGGEDVLTLLAPIAQQELGWSESQWQQECERYLQIWRQYYYLPESMIGVVDSRAQTAQEINEL
ncbi:MAG: FAD-dependent oxidoreductase [Cellvibrionaceae bacterium]|nr:FAD-dependent oxidoreductase [Cellvibrionaceae bacterium]